MAAKELSAQRKAELDQMAFEQVFGAPDPSQIAQTDTPTQQFQQGGGMEQALSGLGKAYQFAEPSILPTAGYAALGPLGGAGGEAINQLMGVTEPSASQIAAAGLVPKAIGAGANVIRTGWNMLPGAGARNLNRIAGQEAMGKVNSMAGLQGEIGTPSVGFKGPDAMLESSRQLFQQATKQGAIIPMTSTLKEIDRHIADLSHGSPEVVKMNSRAVRRLESTKAKIQANQGLSPADLQAELAGYDDFQNELAKKGGGGSRAYISTKHLLEDDLDAAASLTGGPAAELLTNARQLWKRGKTLKEMEGYIQKATKYQSGQGEDVRFNGYKVVEDLQKNRYFKTGFSESEQKDIKDLLLKLNKLPALPPPGGAKWGSGPIWERIALGGAIGGATGLSKEGPSSERLAYGLGSAAAGFLLPDIHQMSKIIVQTVSMKTGRALLKTLLTNSDGTITPKVMSILGAFVTAQSAQPGTEMNQ